MRQRMTDKEAIKRLDELLKCTNLLSDTDHEAMRKGIKALENKRTQGEWIYDNTINNWKCSECGETPKTIGYVGTALFMHNEFKFCNHCGADMRGGNSK